MDEWIRSLRWLKMHCQSALRAGFSRLQADFESGIEGGSGRLGVANGCPMVAIHHRCPYSHSDKATGRMVVPPLSSVHYPISLSPFSSPVDATVTEHRRRCNSSLPLHPAPIHHSHSTTIASSSAPTHWIFDCRKVGSGRDLTIATASTMSASLSSPWPCMSRPSLSCSCHVLAWP
jgi:hypothetical protein